MKVWYTFVCNTDPVFVSESETKNAPVSTPVKSSCVGPLFATLALML